MRNILQYIFCSFYSLWPFFSEINLAIEDAGRNQNEMPVVIATPPTSQPIETALVDLEVNDDDNELDKHVKKRRAIIESDEDE